MKRFMSLRDMRVAWPGRKLAQLWLELSDNTVQYEGALPNDASGEAVLRAIGILRPSKEEIEVLPNFERRFESSLCGCKPGHVAKLLDREIIEAVVDDPPVPGPTFYKLTPAGLRALAQIIELRVVATKEPAT